MLVADTVLSVHVEDRDGTEQLLHQAQWTFPFVKRVIFDAGYE